jgi:hypothetical protein
MDALRPIVWEHGETLVFWYDYEISGARMYIDIVSVLRKLGYYTSRYRWKVLEDGSLAVQKMELKGE